MMEELGCYASKSTRKQLTKELVEWAELVVAIIDREKAPELLRNPKKVLHWEIDAVKDKFDGNPRVERNRIVRQSIRLAENIEVSRKPIVGVTKSKS